MLVEVNWKFWP